VDELRTLFPGINFEIMTTGDANRSKEFPGPSFSGELPLHAIVQWIEDRYDVRFVVRDYGIVVADRDRLPPGALPLLDMARQAPSSQTTGSPGMAPKSGSRP
jgi:hypothetical protein